LFSPGHIPFGKILKNNIFNFNFVILKFKGMSDYENAPQIDQNFYFDWQYNPNYNQDYSPNND
jgi:hypothetical protein